MDQCIIDNWFGAANVPKMTNDAMDLLGGDMKSVLFDDPQHRLDEIFVPAIDKIGTAREDG